MTTERDPRTERLTRIRKVIAERMQASLSGSAQLTSAVEADVTGLMELRRTLGPAFRESTGTSLSPLSVVARGVCLLLPRHPALNARIDPDEGTATYFPAVNLGIAVDTERGLLVPNIRDADLLPVSGLAAAIKDLAERARERRITPEDLEGGTFTITNTGSRGSLWDTPILNSPEVGILAVGAVARRPAVVVRDGEERLEAHDLAYLCLTYDHRLVDGADAARFLSDLKGWLETNDLRAEVDLT